VLSRGRTEAAYRLPRASPPFYLEPMGLILPYGYPRGQAEGLRRTGRPRLMYQSRLASVRRFFGWLDVFRRHWVDQIIFLVVEGVPQTEDRRDVFMGGCVPVYRVYDDVFERSLLDEIGRRLSLLVQVFRRDGFILFDVQ